MGGTVAFTQGPAACLSSRHVLPRLNTCRPGLLVEVRRIGRTIPHPGLPHGEGAGNLLAWLLPT